MSTFLLFVHVLVCVVLVFVVLIQSGKDGGIGVMSGGGSQTVFGSSGGANFFTKFTSVVAGIFMVTSIFLTVVRGGQRTSVFGNAPAAAPAAPSGPAANTSSAPAPTTPASESAAPANGEKAPEAKPQR